MDINTELSKNMVRYMELKKLIELYTEELEMLKDQNLEFVKMIGLKKGEKACFEEVGLAIQLIEMKNNTGLDEEGLVKKYGHIRTEFLWVIPIKNVEMAIKMNKLPKEAECFIKKGEPIEYTRITRLW